LNLLNTNWTACLRKEGLAPLLILLGTSYFFSAKGLLEISDTDYSLRTAKALVENQTFLIDAPDPAVAATSPKVVDGKIYSKYGVGLVVIFLPIVLVAKAMALVPGVQEAHVTGFLVSFYNLPFALGALYFLHRICLQLGSSKRSATIVVLAMGAGTFFWKYTVTDYSEVTQLFFLLGTIFYLFRSREGDFVKGSAFFSALILMKLVNVLLWGPLAVYVAIRHGAGKSGIRKMAAFASVVFITGLLLLLYNHLRFGSPFSTGYESGAPMFRMENFRRDFVAFFISPQRGLFVFNPIVLAALPFWPAFLKQHKAEGFCLVLIVALWFVLMASWVSYQGGWAWGNRLLVFTIPLLLVPLAFTRFREYWHAALFCGLFLISVYIQMIAVFQHTHEYFVILRDMGEDSEVSGYIGAMPAQLVGNAVLAHQKLAGISGEYSYAAFMGKHLPESLSSKGISTKEYDSYQGFHAWPFHLATFLGQPILRWLLAGFLPCLVIILYQMFKLSWPTSNSLGGQLPVD
jgi:hypothetical protein